MASAQKPIPVATDHDRPYWDALKEHRFVLQHCTKCGLFSAQPRVVCPRCHTDEFFEWKAPSGRAKIHSYTIVYQTFTPGFDDEIPYVICHAQLEEEPTCFVTANLAVDQADFDQLDIDLPLVIDYDDRGEATVPLWRLAEGK